MSVWSDVLIGLAFVAGGYWLIKTIYQWNRFRRSIYIEIYSSYFEYAFRRKNLVRLSESFYLMSLESTRFSIRLHRTRMRRLRRHIS